ncbi:MAG: tRNA (N6-isopentenyl adenosine(37)-C2)-methylthiotransferase MiaB [Bacteroidales bacterium]|nr:tRNA (N6-isopentenyl adenosine(37)-C2)-methylthiotransferase MiaB [Bacteroidales bacterium]
MEIESNIPVEATVLGGFTPVGASMGPKVYIETYGCQMNVNDSEVVASILTDAGYGLTNDMSKADVVLINTCAIRENAETRVWGRLDVFAQLKRQHPGVLVGVLGCMAGRLKEELLERRSTVDVVAGPDAYRDLPHLLHEAELGQRGVNVLLSHEETYADISPIRLDRHGVSAFVSIMRGCNNVCAYCVVPYTRGAERSRDPQTIVHEVEHLSQMGYREVTLLGQNVDSYRWLASGAPERSAVSFADLLERVAQVDPRMRIRFATSHPKDLSREVVYTMAMYENICNHIHLPVQSGSDRMLKLMNRHYTRQGYLNRVAAIREVLPDCAITTDVIAGFCTETELDHDQTMSLMREVGFDMAYMFKYSERPNTKAARHYADDVPDGVKTRRLEEIIALQGELSEQSKRADVGRQLEVLVEGPSRKRPDQLMGRTSSNKTVVFPADGHKPGDFVLVEITSCTPATLLGRIVPE